MTNSVDRFVMEKVTKLVVVDCLSAARRLVMMVIKLKWLVNFCAAAAPHFAVRVMLQLRRDGALRQRATLEKTSTHARVIRCCRKVHQFVSIGKGDTVFPIITSLNCLYSAHFCAAKEFYQSSAGQSKMFILKCTQIFAREDEGQDFCRSNFNFTELISLN